LWVSYSCMILFFGAEYTKQLQEKAEGKIAPDENALKMKGQDPINPGNKAPEVIVPKA
jgi:uncharacterized BrkB/YihY/UPF0761 family membrane protein